MKPKFRFKVEFPFTVIFTFSTLPVLTAQELSIAVQEALPETISSVQITETETDVRVTGVVSDYQQVSTLMRMFDERGASPDLKSITNQDDGTGFVFVLDLSK